MPDANGFAATQKALELVQGLTAGDTVLFLLSGGGSALFEQPLVPGAELQEITSQLLASGADNPVPWYGQLMTTPQTIAWFLQVNYWMKKYRVELV